MKLKQSDRRGFSARSSGALDSKSLPTRSFKSRSHLERISSSCIRFGYRISQSKTSLIAGKSFIDNQQPRHIMCKVQRLSKI